MDVKISLNLNIAATEARLKKAAEKAIFETSEAALKDCNAYCPTDQRVLVNSSSTHSEFEEGILRWKTPYARHLYYGIIMVDPKTGKACFPVGDQLRSRKGVAKVKSNREFKFNGNARKMWAHHAASVHGSEWLLRMQKAFKRFSSEK